MDYYRNGEKGYNYAKVLNYCPDSWTLSWRVLVKLRKLKFSGISGSASKQMVESATKVLEKMFKSRELSISTRIKAF
jgi:hypothetical protein